MMFKSTAVKVVQKEEKPIKDEGVQVKPVRKPGTNTVPWIQPEPVITLSHYHTTIKHKGSTIRTPVREAASSAPEAPRVSQERQEG